MNLTEYVAAARSATQNDISFEDAAHIYADFIEKNDPNNIKWAIEDVEEREEWQELVVLAAAAHYYREGV